MLSCSKTNCSYKYDTYCINTKCRFHPNSQTYRYFSIHTKKTDYSKIIKKNIKQDKIRREFLSSKR